MFRYKVILSSNTIYKEAELSVNDQQVKVGTDLDCDIRLRKELFFTPIELKFTRKDSDWEISCCDHLYLTVGDVRKLMTKKLEHGDILELKYQDSDNLIFSLEFLIDFDDGKKQYNRVIDVTNETKLSIGASECDIQLSSEFIKDDLILLSKVDNQFIIDIKNTTYGVFINGKRAQSKDILNNMDFLSISDYFFYFKNQKIWTEARDDIKIKTLPFTDLSMDKSYPKFNRNTRIQPKLCKDDITILDPPPLLDKPKNNLLTRLLPSMGMLMTSGVMALFGGAMIAMSVVSGGLALVTSAITLKQSNKEFKQSCADRIEKYNKYISNKRKDIERFRSEEKLALDKLYISQEEEIKRLLSFSTDLFDRVSSDEDFLAVRLGVGAVESKQKIKYKQQEKLEVEDELQLLPEQLSKEYKFIQNAPVVCNLKTINALGIVGSEYNRYEIFKVMTTDILARHYFSEVKSVFITENKHADKVSMLRMLPHVRVDDESLRLLVTDDESRNIIFDYLYKELTFRQQSKSFHEHLLLFFFDECGFKSHPISKFIKHAKALGVTFIFFSFEISDIPLGCEDIIKLEDSYKGCLLKAEDESQRNDFSYQPLPDEEFKRIIDLLVPVFSEEISLEGTLTKSCSMFEMLHILAADDINIQEKWSTSEIYRSMAAPIGVSKNGIVCLDLHDKAHGPHGLVAGTTGSGKSEILQTYILSMSVLFHPYEVGFVIIDFKGGGMVNQFKKLPHLLGAITNIDGKEIDRSLRSIKAELLKRQRLFAQVEVNHIDKYIKKFKSGETAIPLPHLILIVDEFAELKADQPEFMKELISAARIGRSLGVHLILATQKPSGQVNEQIWSNSKFKLCLKVQNQEDSNEVIKSPLAAEIKEPGRAYLQVGNNEIFELFQSAYSGASAKADDTSAKEFTVKSVSPCGKQVPIYTKKRKKTDGENITQLDALVDYIASYAEKSGIQRLPNICLLPLEKTVSAAGILAKDNKLPIGIYDDPDTQYQGSAYIDFDSNHTIIIGASQSGKTNLLQLLLREISILKRSDEANFYIMDFGSRILKNFEKLKHVGGVVLSSEEEKLKNLFKLLMQELDERKEKIMSVGVSSITAYKEAGYKDIPHIYVMLDNFAAFKELYADKYEDDFLFIAREGITYGISLIVTSVATNGFGYKYMSNFANRIAFRCNDASEYSNLFDRCRIEPSNIPGRMLVSFHKIIYEAQSYLSFDGEKEIDRVNAIKAFVQEQSETKDGKPARKIPEVPDMLDQNYIQNNYSIDVKNHMAVALSYQYVEPVLFNIHSMTSLFIVGKLTGNVVGFEKALLDEIRINYFDRPANVYIIDSLSRDLKDYADESYVEKYSIDYSSLSTVLEDIGIELEDRYTAVLENGIEVLEDRPLLFVLINNGSAIEYMADSKELMAIYSAVQSKYKAMKIVMVFAGINDEAIGYSSNDLLKKLKENKNAVILTNLSEHKVFDIPSQFIRKNKKALDTTQGYYLKESEIIKIRFARRDTNE